MHGLLHRHPPFHAASARIVDDLVAGAAVVHVCPETDWTAGDGLVLVEHGQVALTLEQVPRAGEPASLHRRWSTVASAGTTVVPRLLADPRCDARVVGVEGHGGTARVRRIDAAALTGALRVAPALARGLALDAAAYPRFVWLTADGPAPLAALADVLAATIVRDGGRAATAVWGDGEARVQRWTDGGPEVLRLAEPRRFAAWREVFGEDEGRAPWVLVIGPDSASSPLEDIRLHRVLHVCDRVPERLPDVAAALDPRVLDGAGRPLHGSFVSLVSGRRGATGFATEPLDARDRLRRDAVRWRPDPALLARASRRSGDWVSGWRRRDPAGAAGAESVVRALRHRRVGVAVSGGGAGAYRAVPALRQLHAAGVPVDVMAGASGGAVLGAYYAAARERGLDRFVTDGWALQRAFVRAVSDGEAITRLIDRRFDGLRVEDAPVQFAAVTTRLPPEGPPESHRVATGTLGQAVRASTAIPPIIQAYDRGPVRYLDGAAAAQLPAAALARMGADLTVAIDALTGPSGRNPLGDTPAADAAYRGIAGRVIDAYTWFGVLGQRATAAEGAAAQVYIQPSPTRLPLAMVGLFLNARRIVSEAEHDPGIVAGVARAVALWRGWGSD